jgi:DNA-binding NarL/FixJ family response regulator
MLKRADLKLLIADDHPLLLGGLKDALIQQGYVQIKALINGAQALDYIIDKEPHIAILDIQMPLLSGFEVIKKCRQLKKETQFIILTSYKEQGFILKAKKLNISGYIMKDEPFVEIDKCIQAVMEGSTYFSGIFDSIVEGEIKIEIQKIKLLSPSERTILRMIAQNQNSKQIAESLTISIRTVQKHRSNIINKLELPSKMDALWLWTQKHQELILSL